MSTTYKHCDRCGRTTLQNVVKDDYWPPGYITYQRRDVEECTQCGTKTINPPLPEDLLQAVIGPPAPDCNHRERGTYLSICEGRNTKPDQSA